MLLDGGNIMHIRRAACLIGAVMLCADAAAHQTQNDSSPSTSATVGALAIGLEGLHGSARVAPFGAAAVALAIRHRRKKQRPAMVGEPLID